MFSSTAHLLQTLDDLRLHVLIAMAVLAPELPVGEQRIANMIGRHRDTARAHLRKLEALGLTQQIGTKNAWTLTSKVYQLPLPLLWQGHSGVVLEQETAVNHTATNNAGSQLPLFGSVGSTQSLPDVDESAQSHQAPADADMAARLAVNFSANGSTQSQLHPDGSAQSHQDVLNFSANEDAGSEVMLKVSANDAEDPAVVLKSSANEPAPIQEYVVRSFQDHDLLNDQQHVGDMLKTSAHGDVEAQSRLFLEQIGLDAPVPEQYGDYPLPLALAYWWYGLAQRMKNPQGYLRRRLEHGHHSPVTEYRLLAETYLGLDAVQRRGLLTGLEQVRTPRAKLNLPDGFPFMPFKPLLRAWHGARETERPFLPPCLYPDGTRPVHEGDGCPECGAVGYFDNDGRCLVCLGVVKR